MLSAQEGQDKINRIKQELEPANIEVWRAKFDDDTYGDRLGIVYKPSDSTLQFNYVVCEVANIGTIEKDGDIELDVDDERTKQLRLIVSAPDMLRAIRRAIVDLEAVTGLQEFNFWRNNMATAGQLWELLHEAASHVEAGELRESIQEALDSGCSLSEHKEILEVCDEIERIVHDYENETCSTPGGLEHLGDVWRLLSKWNDKLKAVRDGETTVG